MPNESVQHNRMHTMLLYSDDKDVTLNLSAVDDTMPASPHVIASSLQTTHCQEVSHKEMLSTKATVQSTVAKYYAKKKCRKSTMIKTQKKSRLISQIVDRAKECVLMKARRPRLATIDNSSDDFEEHYNSSIGSDNRLNSITDDVIISTNDFIEPIVPTDEVTCLSVGSYKITQTLQSTSQDDTVIKSQDDTVIKSQDDTVIKSQDDTVIKSQDDTVIKSQDEIGRAHV